MTRDATSCGSSSSSSGFSSDEDLMDVAEFKPSTFPVPTVHVDVLDESEETDTQFASSSAPTESQAPEWSSDVSQSCQEAVKSILQASRPHDMPYEQYVAAIGHVTSQWPSSETVSDGSELEIKLKSYSSLRAELYKTFQLAYPLTEDMYVQWISDCRARGDPIEELKMLFELSQADYWSVSIALQYLRLIKDHGDEEELEMAMTKAQKTVGMHFTRGHEVWALCRDFVTEKYEDTDEKFALEKEQTIRKLFCRQMRLPLDQNDLVMSEFRAWNAYNTRDADDLGFEKALERQSKLFAPLMKKLRAFEAKVNATVDPEQDWQHYLNFVKHRVASLMASEDEGKQLVVCLYERALSVMCLSTRLWTSYLDYVESDLTKSRLAIARRAVRNVPFDSSIWMELLIELERQHVNCEKISQLIQRELMIRSDSPMSEIHLLSTLLTWCDIVRRHVSSSFSTELSFENTVQLVETQVDAVFTKCQQLMTKMFPDYVQGKLLLAEYHAKCYWTLLSMNRAPDVKVVAKVNELWQNTLRTSLGDYAATWIAYLNALQRMNFLSVENIRTMVFDEAVQRVKVMPLAIADSWLVFERENGDLTNYLRARRNHVKHCESVQLSAAPAGTTDLSTDRVKSVQNEKKRKASATKQSKATQIQPPAKRVRASALQSTKSDGSTARKSAEKKKQHENRTNEHTLFLCNVSKDASQGDLEELFRDIPTLKDVRLVVKTRGDRVLSRGMAYVQFLDDEGVQAGLRRNGFLLHGHPLRIERSKPPVVSASTAITSKGQNFWKSDPLTVYVGYLNREGSNDQVTEAQLQVAFQQSMQTTDELVVVTRVSILKDRHGKWKNYGLVEVAEASQVAICLANVAALQATLGDQVTIKPSRFSIAHILEQQEKQVKQKLDRKGESYGGNAPHTQPNTRLAIGSTTSLLPRALRRNTAGPTKALATGDVVPKSNDDFRKLFFDK